jgi:hypothetical protein
VVFGLGLKNVGENAQRATRRVTPQGGSHLRFTSACLLFTFFRNVSPRFQVSHHVTDTLSVSMRSKTKTASSVMLEFE